MKTVGDGSHSVFTNTVSNVCASICPQAGVRRLEVDAVFNFRQVASCEISRSTNKLGKMGGESGENNFRQLARSLSRIRGFVDGEVFLPILRKFASNSASELCVFFWILLTIGCEERIPFRLKRSPTFAKFSVQIIGCLRNVVFLLRWETEFGFQCLNVLSLQSCEIDQERNYKLQIAIYEREPCTPWVPCCLEPYPMVVLNLMMVGLPFSCRASAIALWMLVRSLKDR